MPATLAASRYVNEVNTTLERDSAGRALTEHVLTRGVILLQGRRDTLGGFRGTGTVDSFTVQGLERVLSPGAGERSSTPVPVLATPALSVNFDATLDARVLRVATRPALANECDRAEVGATNLVRDVMVRLPRTLAIGQSWQDSTIGFQCRLGVPITSRTKNSYIIERADKVQDRTELVVRKTSDTQMTGEIKSTWRVMTVSATGRATQVIRVDATSGVVRGAESDGQLTVKLNDTSRRDGSGVQEVRQTTRGRVTFLR